MPAHKPAPERFARLYTIDEATGCWLWQGYVDKKGYGRFGAGKPSGEQMAYRFGWIMAFGPVPPGLELDHTCKVRRCVNPAHLEAVPHLVNVRRGASAQRLRTHCPFGHPYDETNTHVRPSTGWRECRACWARRRA